MCVINALTKKIYNLPVSREKPPHHSLIFSIRENDISMKIMRIYVKTV